jgi:lipopolysaccharide export system protein LptA
MTLDTDDMTVKVHDTEVSEIVALGNIMLRQADRYATGDKAVYDASAETVILTGRTARFVDETRGLVEGPILVVHTSGNEMAVQSDGARRTTSRYKVKK